MNNSSELEKIIAIVKTGNPELSNENARKHAIELLKIPKRTGGKRKTHRHRKAHRKTRRHHRK